MNEYATIVGYEPSPYHEGWLQRIHRMHYNGKIERGGQVPAEGTIVATSGLSPRLAEAPLPIGTIIQL